MYHQRYCQRKDRFEGFLREDRHALCIYSPDVRTNFRQPSAVERGECYHHQRGRREENAIIISEGDYMGRIFFKDLYSKLGLNIYEYTFEEHDKTVAYSLSIPFVSTFVFAAVMKHQDAPGTTFKRHMRIAKGVLNEDDYLLQEILFNPYTGDQVAQIRTELKELLEIIDKKDAAGMKSYLTKIRNNVKRDIEIKK